MKEYVVWMKLKDSEGKIYHERHIRMSLTDFEVLYGNISDEILEVYLYQTKGIK